MYVSRAPAGGELRNQLLRLRIRHGEALARQVLLNAPIGTRSNHNGGRIAFGPDGKLYVVIGDGGEDPATAQTLADEPRGKILRLDPDGSVPASNPFGSLVVVLRTPQLDRLRVRSARPGACGKARTVPSATTS